tara:strand:+ start:655 stop:1368 length:714 start_codon:yes stop_codon:yes gene_type:complete
MPRVSATQRQRTQNNPLTLGPFDQLTVRNLVGSLGPENKLTSNGYGGGTYNHWFRVEISSPAWIILAKGGARKKFIDLSVYDLNLKPITGRAIFDRDSVKEIDDDDIYYPYEGHVMSASSDLYNTLDRSRLDGGDDRYFPLGKGGYLLCISSTRNEKINYEVGMVVEFPTTDFDIIAENFDKLLFENGDFIAADLAADYVENDKHNHSLSEWRTAWEREQQQTHPFPVILIPYATRP